MVLATRPDRGLLEELPLLADLVSSTQHITRQIGKVTCSPCEVQGESPSF